jgi:cytochrome P450
VSSLIEQLRRPAKPRPPGPRGLPLLGCLPGFAADPLAFLEHTAKRYGDLSHFKLGHGSVMLLTHPADIEAVLVGEHKHCIKDRVTRMLIHVLGEGLLTAEGDTWRRQRKLAAPTFTPRHIAGYAETMVEHAERSCARVAAAGNAEDLYLVMARLTLEIVLDTVFGGASSDHAAIARHLDAVMHEFFALSKGIDRVLPPWLRTPTKARLRAAVAGLDELLYRMIDTRRRAELATPDDARERDDLFSRMLAARDEHGAGMSDVQLRDEALTLVIAGHETTALSLTHALRWLARRPALAARARAELDAVLGERRPGPEDLPALPFVGAIIDESLRMYPPAWAIGREATEPFVLRGADGRSWDIEIGDNLFISPWLVHRDPRWWPEPIRFAPQRWLEPHDRPKFAFFPFGGGPRICIGNYFAKLEAVLILAVWLRELDIEIEEPPLGLELLPSITLRPVQALPLTARRRRQVARFSSSRQPD